MDVNIVMQITNPQNLVNPENPEGLSEANPVYPVKIRCVLC